MKPGKCNCKARIERLEFLLKSTEDLSEQRRLALERLSDLIGRLQPDVVRK